jgi:hypothetical protein
LKGSAGGVVKVQGHPALPCPASPNPLTNFAALVLGREMRHKHHWQLPTFIFSVIVPFLFQSVLMPGCGAVASLLYTVTFFFVRYML